MKEIGKGKRSLWRRLLRIVMWGVIAVLALLALAVFMVLRPVKPPAPNAVSTVPQPVIGSSAPLVQILNLADLTLPPAPPRLRTTVPEFAAGMKAYTGGDCAAAIPHLLRVPATEDEGETAQFYAAACQLAAHKLNDATRNFLRVTGEMESPEYEAAHYYLAQVMLASGDVTSARQYLRRTMILGGDYARPAQAQLDRLQSLH